MKKFISLFLLFVFISLTHDSLMAQETKAGDQITKLEIEKYFQAPQQNYSFDELKGKALVLEFWATWCAPCIKLMPHLNNLSQKFSDDPIQFISITDESESTVNHFLERHKIDGWIGLDTDRSVHKLFNIYAIPQTILIDPSGKVAAITRANKINSNIIEKLISGKPIDINGKEPQSSTNENTNTKETKVETTPLLEVIIRSTEKQAGSTMTNTSKGIFTASSISVQNLLQRAYQFSPSRIIATDSLLNKKLHISIKAPNQKGENFLNVLQNALTSSLDLAIKRETKNVEVYVLKAPNGVDKGLRVYEANVRHASTDDGVIAASAHPITQLMSQLENLLNTPIIDNTKLKESYAWTVTFNANQPKSVIVAVQDQLGLELQKEQRNIEMLIVEQK